MSEVKGRIGAARAEGEAYYFTPTTGKGKNAVHKTELVPVKRQVRASDKALMERTLKANYGISGHKVWGIFRAKGIVGMSAFTRPAISPISQEYVDDFFDNL